MKYKNKKQSGQNSLLTNRKSMESNNKKKHQILQKLFKYFKRKPDSLNLSWTLQKLKEFEKLYWLVGCFDGKSTHLRLLCA